MSSSIAKNFVLMFEGLHSFHLHKDVGQIPFQLYKHYGFDSEIACFKNEKNYAYINAELKGLKLSFFRFSRYLYILLNAHRIDVLMLFHISTKTIYRGLLYKLLNPAGYLYVKADLASDRVIYSSWEAKNPITVLKRKILYQLFLSRVNLISFETKRSFEGASDIPLNKKSLLPNGFDPDLLDYFGIRPKEFHEKDNVILLVGRHGDHAKNSEFMLDVLAQMGDLAGWTVYFIGPMTNEFIIRKDAFLDSNPQFKDKVIFTGPVNDKRQLFEYYNRSKILCLTSRSESWGLVCVEGLCFGNTLIMTNVNSADDLTDNGKAGFKIEQGDITGYTAALKLLMTNTAELLKYHKYALYHFNNSYIWKNILVELAGKITRRK
jgi:glycosyltransferase involved in cell wall biosynthesis